MSIESCIDRLIDIIMFHSDKTNTSNSNNTRTEDTELDSSYKEYIKSPDLSVTKLYFRDVYETRSNIYRYISLAFVGSDVSKCIAQPFLWYYLDQIKHVAALDSDGLSNWKAVTATFHNKYDNTNKLWHTWLVIDEFSVYFAWDRPENLVINVIFSCDRDLYESILPWADLVKKCVT